MQFACSDCRGIYSTLENLLEHLNIFSEARDPANEEHHVEPGGEAADAGGVVLPTSYFKLTVLKH